MYSAHSNGVVKTLCVACHGCVPALISLQRRSISLFLLHGLLL